jgi:hypothetical protein
MQPQEALQGRQYLSMKMVVNTDLHPASEEKKSNDEQSH